MALPKAVQRQLDEADALAAQQANQPQPVFTDVTQPPAPQPAPVAPPAEPPAQPPAEDWQQKYRTLQGMFQAEVPSLKAQNQRMVSELATAREQIAALTAAVQKVQQAAPAPAQPEPQEIDPRDARAFGEDMVEMVNRYAQRTFAQAQQRLDTMTTKFESRLTALEQAITGVSQRTQSTMESQFYATLDQLVPDWKTVNQTSEWLEWLGQVDEVYNVPRQTALDVAFERRDAPRVAAVFKQFAKLKPAKPAVQSVAPLITPSEGGGGPVNPPAPQAKPMITQKVVQQFYTDVARGRYQGRDAERQRIENEIDLAAAEGRLI